MRNRTERAAEPCESADDWLAAARAAGPQAVVAGLFDRHALEVRRLLLRILGRADQELEDLFQEVFTRALGAAHGIRDPRYVRSWLLGIAVNAAKELIRSRRRRSWLRLPGALPDAPGAAPAPEARDAVHAFYLVLQEFPTEERIPFALRTMAGMTLEEIAAVCGLSFITLRRRLDRAKARFERLCPRYPALVEWMDDE
jgi:RNA polymerase sigma-70 factor (ECF subfamily)